MAALRSSKRSIEMDWVVLMSWSQTTWNELSSSVTSLTVMPFLLLYRSTDSYFGMTNYDLGHFESNNKQTFVPLCKSEPTKAWRHRMHQQSNFCVAFIEKRQAWTWLRVIDIRCIQSTNRYSNTAILHLSGIFPMTGVVFHSRKGLGAKHFVCPQAHHFPC